MDAGKTCLEPLRWRLEAPPPIDRAASDRAASVRTASDRAAVGAPAVLLLDRRDPLPVPLTAELLASLDPRERQRHAALRRSADRERFLLGRGGLRRLLGAWLGLPPGAVPLAVAAHGKPHCPGGPPFNVSHSGDLILLAVHPERAVGVDVEQARPGLDWRPIARRTLPPERVAWLEALPEAQQPEAFLGEWCRLEARLKAIGTGLVGLETLARHGAGPALWELALPPGYSGAVALAAAAGLTDRRQGAAAPH